MTCANVIDWEATGSMLQGIGAILGSFTVVGAALIASQTFKTWRQQKVAERRVEQAERILTATYNARRRLEAVRSPAMWAAELDDAEGVLKERGEWDKATGEPAKKKLAEAQAYYTRLASADDARAALRECLPMARALFSEEVEKALEGLHHQFHTVSVYVGANHRDKDGADRDFRRKIETTIWTGYPSREENTMDQEIAAQVKRIEDVCVPAIRLEEPGRSTSKNGLFVPFLRAFSRFRRKSGSENGADAS